MHSDVWRVSVGSKELISGRGLSMQNGVCVNKRTVKAKQGIVTVIEYQNLQYSPLSKLLPAITRTQ